MRSTFFDNIKITSIDMKRIIITMLVAMLMLVTIEAKPVKKAAPAKNNTEQAVDNEAALNKNANEQASDVTGETNSDEAQSSLTVTDDENNHVDITNDNVTIKQDDGTTVKMKLSDLSKFVSKHLDDTLLSIDHMNGMSETNEATDTSEPREDLAEASYSNREFMNRGMDLAEDITRGFLVAVVFIVFFSLLFYYMHRRRKYKTVDRAIQAGYPLPNEFFSKNSQPAAPQQPTTVYVNQFTPPAPEAGAPQAPNPTPGYTPPTSSNPLNNITDWAPFKSGFVTTAVGLGLLFFFWIAGMEAIAALMLIVIFIGLGRLFITYQEQQNAKNYWQQQQWTQQPQQPQQPEQPQHEWQQWSQQQQENVPPMPNNPSEFDQTK